MWLLMKNTVMSREKMMQFVRETGFAVLDSALYLDTHPCDENAMDYFSKYQRMHKDAVHDYEKNFGPLTLAGVDTDNGYQWTQEPWPWEGGCN
jgi:spore coat protein JB